MLIVALVLAVIGLAALVTAVVTSNELVAWVCIAASVIGVILLIVDAIRERQHRRVDDAELVSAPAVAAESMESSATAETTAYADTDESVDSTYSTFDADYPDEELVLEEQAEEPKAESEAEPEAESEAEPEAESEPEAETDAEPDGEKPDESASR
jgi:hypothetical protein